MLAAVADLIFVIIMVMGVDVKANMNAIIIFAVVNALIGILINVLLRYQGQKYGETENEDLCKAFYNKQIKEKKYMSMTLWMTLKTVQDVIIKGVTTCFSIFGILYITIVGSKSPVQILITLASLVLFACFGLIGMNSAYCRFYNIQIPYMQMKIEERNGNNNNNNTCTDSNVSSSNNIITEVTEINVNQGQQDIQESSGTSSE